ncbi:hypothetical protein HDU87_002073 [Geranomyces variabilis]|uniref:RNI-like protein n=1 Tax=Geranomyces variabilis TaxID=109894 RepID=A0AAD5TAS5_9FUNG|nr:hypothetical protein HDU87_002073 [Geranomyces variabilis]
MSVNRVRGPSSALSSFLAERGIRAPPRNVWAARGTNTPAAATPPSNESTTSLDSDDGQASSDDDDQGRSRAPQFVEPNPNAPLVRSTRAAARAVGPHEDSRVGLAATLVEVEVTLANGSADEDAVNAAIQIEEENLEAVGATAAGQKRKATLAKSSAAGSVNKAATNKRKKGSSNDDFGIPDEGSGFARSNHSKRRKVPEGESGSLRFCDRCQRRYMVGDDQRYLCRACVSLQAAPASQGVAKKSGKKKKGEVIPEGADDRRGGIRSLRDTCIKLIADLIDSVEEFGDVSETTKLKISKIIGRQRQLNPVNMLLFVGPTEERVTLFECSYLDDPTLTRVAELSPSVRHLHLGNCGRLRESTLKAIGDNCSHLESLNLDGPFLPGDESFAAMFEAIGDKLLELTLRHAAKLSQTGVDTLVRCCPNLTTLRLDHCFKLDDHCVRSLATLRLLQTLELGFMNRTIAEDAILYLMENGSANIRSLTLDRHPNVTDRVLMQIATSCPHLSEISIVECESITSEGLLDFIRALQPTVILNIISLARIVHLNDDVIIALVNRFGRELIKLNLNGLDELSERSLRALATGCPHVRDLDVSWIRNVDDFMLVELLANAPELASIRVYGCNKLTENLINKRILNSDGQEIRFVGNEFT